MSAKPIPATATATSTSIRTDGDLPAVGGPDALRRRSQPRRHTAPYWLKRPLKPVKEAYTLPEKPFGR